jgi:hypothetical protein
MKVYVVQMYRWGEVEKHSYIEGVYDSLAKAKSSGEWERINRGGKYAPQIKELELNKAKNKKTII